MDDVKLFTKNEKELENPNTDSKNIQSEYWDWICRRKMCYGNNEKRKTT